jgi:hypothetical protein
LIISFQLPPHLKRISVSRNSWNLDGRYQTMDQSNMHWELLSYGI